MRHLARTPRALGASSDGGIPGWVWVAGLSALAILALSQSKTVTSAVEKFAFAAGDPTDKKLATLDSGFRKVVEEFVRRARAAGYRIVISSGTRTMQEQRDLYAKGRTAPGDIVTNADAGQSPHNFGLAVDFAFGNALGQPTWPDDGPWGDVARIGKQLGLVWGGDFKSIVDRPHLEAPNWRDVQTAWRQSGQTNYAIV